MMRIEGEAAFYRHNSGQITQCHIASDDIPVVVIDPEDAEQTARLVSLYMGEDFARREGHVEDMRRALREFANPTPRIEEPRGLGAVVEDADGVRWVRTEGLPNLGGTVWSSAFHPSLADKSISREWRDITAVRVLSEGVTS